MSLQIAKIIKPGHDLQFKIQLEKIAQIDNLVFFNIPDITYIEKDDIIVPGNLSISNDIIRISFRLNSGKDSIYLSDGTKSKPDLTEDQKEKGLELLKFIQKIKIIAYFSEKIGKLVPTATHEKETWEKQKIQSDIYEADNTAEVKFLRALAEARNIDIKDLSSKIQKKAEEYELLIANTMGEQHKYEDIVKGIDTFEKFRTSEIPSEFKVNIW